VVGGGPAYKVKDWCDRHGVAEYLPDLLPERVYVGISAGSMLTNPHLAMSTSSSLWGELGEDEDPWRPGFGFVDFYVRPHLDHPDFPSSRESVVPQAAAKMPGTGGR
jgi:dipeptidase E